MNIRQAIGAVIRAERTEQGYSQRGFAESIGRDQSSWSKAEMGVSAIPAERLVLICDELDIEPSDLILRARRLAGQ